MCWPEKWQAQRLGTSYLRTTGIPGVWQPLCRAGSPYHIISSYLLHKTFTRNLRSMGRGEQNFQKFWLKWRKNTAFRMGLLQLFGGLRWHNRSQILKRLPLPRTNTQASSIWLMVASKRSSMSQIRLQKNITISYLRKIQLTYTDDNHC